MQGKERLKGKVEEILPVRQQITLLSNREALIEGCKGVLELEEDRIKLSCKECTVAFNGTALRLGCLTDDTAAVYGTIVGVEFE